MVTFTSLFYNFRCILRNVTDKDFFHNYIFNDIEIIMLQPKSDR